MAVKKQPDSNPGNLSEATDEWLRLFLKHLEVHLLQTIRQLNATPSPSDFGLASLRAVKLTLLHSGIPPEQLTGLLGLVFFVDSAEQLNLSVDPKTGRTK